MPDPFVPTDPYAEQGYQPPAAYQPYPRHLYKMVDGALTHRVVRDTAQDDAAQAEGWHRRPEQAQAAAAPTSDRVEDDEPVPAPKKGAKR